MILLGQKIKKENKTKVGIDTRKIGLNSKRLKLKKIFRVLMNRNLLLNLLRDKIRN